MRNVRIVKMVILGIVIYFIGSVFIAYYPSINRTKDKIADVTKEEIISVAKDKTVAVSRNLKSWVLYDKPYKRRTSATNICMENLTKIDHATQEWALENRKKGYCVPSATDLLPYLKTFPKCPNGGTYIINSVDKHPMCSLEGIMCFNYTEEYRIQWHRVIIFGIIAFLLIFLLFLNFIPFGRRIRDKIGILNLGKRIIRSPTT